TTFSRDHLACPFLISPVRISALPQNMKCFGLQRVARIQTSQVPTFWCLSPFLNSVSLAKLQKIQRKAATSHLHVWVSVRRREDLFYRLFASFKEEPQVDPRRRLGWTRPSGAYCRRNPFPA